MKKEYVILQTVAPDYRSKLYSFIEQTFGDKFVVYAGLEYFESSVKTDTSINSFERINNIFVLKKSFLIQTGMWRDVLGCKTLVLEMNPRILSNWIIILIRKLLSKKTFLWGHAWPRQGAKSRTNALRRAMRNLGNGVIVYTNSQKLELLSAEPKQKVDYAPNALYLKDEMKIGSLRIEEINNLIYVGRLTGLKKPKLLLEAFHAALPELDKNANLLFIGDGEEKKSLEAYITNNSLTDRVKLLGHISDYNKLKEYYSKSHFSVSPGYIGLSVTQSLGFGVPMIVSKNEKHSPEIEAVEKDVNAVFFETNNLESLKLKIIEVYRNKEFWFNSRESISNSCKEKYSINAMANTFIQIFSKN